MYYTYVRRVHVEGRGRGIRTRKHHRAATQQWPRCDNLQQTHADLRKQRNSLPSLPSSIALFPRACVFVALSLSPLHYNPIGGDARAKPRGSIDCAIQQKRDRFREISEREKRTRRMGRGESRPALKNPLSQLSSPPHVCALGKKSLLIIKARKA